MKRKPKPVVMSISPKAKREVARQHRERLLKTKLERERNDALIVLLTHFINRHYGNPVTGRHAAIITGPVAARLSAASSLRALLTENEPLQ